MVAIFRGVQGQEVEPPLEEGPPLPESSEEVTPLPLPLPHIQVGGRLAHFAQNWQKVTNNKLVLSLVKTGYRIPFIERPPLSVDPIFFQQSLSPQLEEEVASLLQKGAMEEIHPVSPGFYSRIYLVPKKNGNVRLIIDLSTLLEHRHYIMYLITSLGLIINYQKSNLIPTQIFTFIGMEFLTYSNIVRVPHPRVQKLLETIMIIYQKTFISARVFLSLLGQLSAAADFVMLGRLHLRPLQMSLLSQWRPQKFSLNHQIKISANILHHLDWWKQEEIYQQGVPLRINPPSHTIFTAPACRAGVHMWNRKDYCFMESGRKPNLSFT